MPELNDGMLLRNTGVLEQEIRHLGIAAHKPDAAFVQVDGVEQILLLEHVHPPLLFGRGLASFRGLVVFEDGVGALDGVGFLR